MFARYFQGASEGAVKGGEGWRGSRVKGKTVSITIDHDSLMTQEVRASINFHAILKAKTLES